MRVGGLEFFLEQLLAVVDGILIRAIPIALVYLLWRAVRALEERNRVRLEDDDAQ